MIISSKFATLHELNTVYTLENVYQMADIIRTDNHNSNVIQENAKQIEARKRT